MPAILDAMRTGAWLTRSRMRLWACAVLLVSAAAVLFVIATAHGLTDYQGRPIGTDFSNVYAAGTYVLDGDAEAPFDSPRQYAREQRIFGAATPFYGWHYPPFFLFVAAALATMPYLLALAVWQSVTLALYLLAVRAVLRHGRPPAVPPGAPPRGALAADPLWLVIALAYPAVFVNLGHGHNGFLTAALFAAGLVLLDRRPIAAGVLFGLLAYKPQFGLLLPLVLVTTGRWRATFAAAVTVAALVVVATLAFGTSVWEAFAAGSGYTRAVVLEQGETGWQKIQSVFAWVRMWGGTVHLAYAVQALVSISIAVASVWLWRSRAAYPLKAAALLVGAVLATPYSLDYDMMVLAPAIALMATEGHARGFRPYEKSALALMWFAPLVARGLAQATLIPLGVLAMAAVFALILWRASQPAAPGHVAPQTAG